MNLFGSGTKTVTTAGTRVRLSDTPVIVTQLWIQPNSGNTGVVVLGDSNVVAAAGTRQGVALLSAETLVIGNGSYTFDLRDVWIDATQNGDKAHFDYLKSAGAA